MLLPEVPYLTTLKSNIPSAVEHDHMIHSLHDYRGWGKLKVRATHKTRGLSNLRERGDIRKNMDALFGSVLHILDNLPCLDETVPSALSDTQ